MKTGEKDCGGRQQRAEVRVVSDGDQSLRSELEGIVAGSLRARELAEASETWRPAASDSDVPADVRIAFASFLFRTMHAVKCLEEAEAALEAGAKLRLPPADCRRARHLLRLGRCAGDEVVALLPHNQR